MPQSEKSKSKASSKSKSKAKDGKSDKKDKKSESKDKKSDKKDKKDKKSEKGDKSVKSDKKSDKKSKSDSPSKSDKDKKKKKDSKSSKDKKELDESASKIDVAELKSQIEDGPPKPEATPEPDPQLPGPEDAANLAKQANEVAAMGNLACLPGGPMNTPLPGPFDRKRFCILHQSHLKYFCVSCEELICYHCTTMGPHNTQLHRISSIEDAFKDRFDVVNRQIHQSLVPKRAQLIGQIVRLDHRLDEIKAVKGVIDKDIRDEYAAIMARLKSAEGVKLAVLQYDIAEIQKDITRIDEILMSMEEIASGDSSDQQNQMIPGMPQAPAPQHFGPDSLQFLHKYRQINDNIEYAVTKHFKVDVDVLPNDLPRELAERRVLMDHYEEQRKLLKFKDDVIYKLSQELKKKYDYFQDEFDKETRNEMNEWAKLVDRYGGELKKFDLVCAFCGQHMNDHNVNTDCIENNQHALRGKASASQNSINMGSDVGHLSMYYTEDEPALEILGKKRHFFGKPSLRGITSINQGIRQGQDIHADLNEANAMTMSAGGFSGGPSGEAIFKNPDSKEALRKICSSQSDLRNKFENQFRALDTEQQGVLRKDDFVNSVFQIARGILEPAQILNIVQQLTTSLDDAVNYEDFLRLLDKARLYGDGDSQDGAGPHLVNAMREQMRQRIMSLSQQDRESVERLRHITKEIIINQGIDLGNVFSKFAQKGSDKISLDELLIAMSRVFDQINLGDIKDLYRILIGAAPGTVGLAGFEDAKIPINEVVQMLTL